MAKVFISYRRDDSGYVVGMLAEKLQSRFGSDAVFLDIDNIPLGFDFRDHIAQAVQQCDVLVAVIGDSWITAISEDGQRRIDSPTDFVRLEIEAALNRGIPVVPVLVDSARMPTENELPPSLQGMVYRNAAEIRAGRDLHHHLDVLIRGIDSLVRTQPVTNLDTASGKTAGDPLRSERNAAMLKTDDVLESAPDAGRATVPLTRDAQPSYLKAMLLNALFGCGLFYADRKASRRWLYPSLILPGIIVMVSIIPNYSPGQDLLFATAGALVYPVMLLVAVAYVSSYIDVIRVCALKRKISSE